jgi:hypothetical protein
VIIRGKTSELISSEPLFQRLSQEFSTFFRKLLDNSAAAATSRLSMKQLRPDDAELVAKAQAGDREAFAQLYDRHAAMVRAVARDHGQTTAEFAALASSSAL